MKNGIVKENGKLIYYKDNVPSHVGAVEIDGNIYYVGRHGVVATGQHIVHGEMSNGLLERGTYTFDEDGKLIEGSFKAPKKVTHHKHHKRSSSSKNKHRIKKRKLTAIIIIVLGIALLLAFTLSVDKFGHDNNSADETSESNIVMPTFNEPVNLCILSAQNLYNHKVEMNELNKIERELEKNKHIDNTKCCCVPLEFNYQLADTDGELFVSENSDLSNPKSYILSKSETQLDIYNLKTGTTYYYRVDIGGTPYTKGSFKTAEGTRYIHVSGMYNARDIGGYTTENGKKIKQGMIIRSAEIDGLQEASYYVSQKDIARIREQFGFVFDMDLRESYIAPSDYTSPLGEDVIHKFYDAPDYIKIFNSNNYDTIREIFADLANPNNYPMHMHCSWGSDRTGTIVYLLQGLLGLNDEDLLREYHLSGFEKWDFATNNRMDSVKEKLSNYPGSTTRDKIEYFLTEEVGVTPEQITSIRNILLEN